MQYKYISSDDHMDLCYVPPDMWQERVPARFKEAAPKVVQTETGAGLVPRGKALGHLRHEARRRPQGRLRRGRPCRGAGARRLASLDRKVPP